jgi:hypothetical protein
VFACAFDAYQNASKGDQAMTKLLIPVILALAGCASQPMTPEQAAVFMQMQRGQQAANAASWQQMQQGPLFQPMPLAQPYQQPAPAYVPQYMPPPRRNINCNSFINGQYVNTTCN